MIRQTRTRQTPSLWLSSNNIQFRKELFFCFFFIKLESRMKCSAFCHKWMFSVNARPALKADGYMTRQQQGKVMFSESFQQVHLGRLSGMSVWERLRDLGEPSWFVEVAWFCVAVKVDGGYLIGERFCESTKHSLRFQVIKPTSGSVHYIMD